MLISEGVVVCFWSMSKVFKPFDEPLKAGFNRNRRLVAEDLPSLAYVGKSYRHISRLFRMILNDSFLPERLFGAIEHAF